MISYTDIVGSLMSSVTTIINTISYVLIAFCGDFSGSFVHYDRCHYLYQCFGKKEGNRNFTRYGSIQKKCIRVFNAETFIIGVPGGGAGYRYYSASSDSCQRNYSCCIGQSEYQCGSACCRRRCADCFKHCADLNRRYHSVKKATKEDPVTALRTE